MPTVLRRNSQLLGTTLGIAGAIVLLALTSRAGMAEKQQADNCDNGYASLCRLVETCTPKGFEANGTCRWIYTASRYYWR